jgi:hypothetical protein
MVVMEQHLTVVVVVVVEQVALVQTVHHLVEELAA